MHKKIYGLLIITMFLLSGCALHTNKNDNQTATTFDQTITVGGAFALTGDAASWGESEMNAVTMAFEEINKKGGVDGKQLELKVEDTGTNNIDTLSATRKLINIDHVDVVIGPTWLDSTPAAVAVAEEGDKLMLTPSASIAAIKSEQEYANVFSTFYRSDKQGYQLGEYVAKNGYKKIAMIFNTDPFYIDFAENITKGVLAEGGEIQITEYVNYGDLPRTSLLKIIQQKPDAIIFGLYDEKALTDFLNNMRAQEPDMPLFTLGDVEKDFLSREQYTYDQFLGVEFIAYTPMPDEFITKYKNTFNDDPHASASIAYDSAYIVADALKNKGNKTFAEYLSGTSFETITFGQIQFDEMGGLVTEREQFYIRRVTAEGVVDVAE